MLEIIVINLNGRFKSRGMLAIIVKIEEQVKPFKLQIRNLEAYLNLC